MVIAANLYMLTTNSCYYIGALYKNNKHFSYLQKAEGCLKRKWHMQNAYTSLG